MKDFLMTKDKPPNIAILIRNPCIFFVEIFHIMGEALRWSSRAGKWGLQGDSETAEEVQMQTFDCQRKLPHTCTNDLCVSARMCKE